MISINPDNLKGYSFIVLFLSLASCALGIYGIIAGRYITGVEALGLLLLPSLFSTYTSFMLLKTGETTYVPLFWCSVRFFVIFLVEYFTYAVVHNSWVEDVSNEGIDWIHAILNMLFISLTVLLALRSRVNIYLCVLANTLIASFFFSYFNSFGPILLSSSGISMIGYYFASKFFKWDQNIAETVSSLNKSEVDPMNFKGFSWFFFLLSLLMTPFIGVAVYQFPSYGPYRSTVIFPIVFSVCCSFMVLKARNSSYNSLLWYNIRLCLLFGVTYSLFTVYLEPIHYYYSSEYCFAFSNLIFTSLTILLGFDVKVNFYVCMIVNVIISFFSFLSVSGFESLGISIFVSSGVVWVLYFIMSYRNPEISKTVDEMMEEQPLKSTNV
jgi:hypothetical protein